MTHGCILAHLISHRFKFSNSPFACTTVIASEAKQSMPQHKERMDCFVAEPVIGAHSRDPLAPLRKRFAFVAGNDVETHIRIPAARFARVMQEPCAPKMRAWGMPDAQCTRSRAWCGSKHAR
jgi:hypothetical protein